MKLLSNKELFHSTVVANSTMNRNRKLDGINSYEKELRFSVKDLLVSNSKVRWLDLCCGQGIAIIEASRGLPKNFTGMLCGIDLVGDFPLISSQTITFIEGVIPEELPNTTWDLITCVHGLHYIGDKLAVLEWISQHLTPNGLFLGNFSHQNCRSEKGKTLRGLTSSLQTSPWSYSTKTNLLELRGYSPTEFPFRYIGACDQAGPNYTQQPVVNSYYQ